MNKTLKALLKGYVFFKVNDKYFLQYNSALLEQKNIIGNIFFNGFNIFYFILFKYSWRCFFYRYRDN